MLKQRYWGEVNETPLDWLTKVYSCSSGIPAQDGLLMLTAMLRCTVEATSFLRQPQLWLLGLLRG